jgi:hypothetical protein
MKALSVQQPFANKIIFDGKYIENRTRRTNFRGMVAIHASLKLHPAAKKGDQQLVRGAIVGVVDVVDCVDDHYSKHFFGPYGYVLTNPRSLVTPVPCKDALGIGKFRLR